MRITGNLSGAKTARQKLLYQPDESDKWYKGATPTASEITARIVTVAKTNKQAATAAFDSLKLLQQQPSSPLYNPYTAPTNASLLALSEIGIDTSKGVTDEWVQQYSYLKDYYRVGASGTPLAPSTKSTPEENAAYHYYKVLQAEDTTRKAETEWAALQEEINYWTNRSDRNYSDEQVLAKIDWAKYPTLAALDEDKQLGTPTALNRPIEYSQDAINGVLYAARNKSTGSAFTDSVKYVMQGGSGYRANKAVTGALDPTSDQYNPYALGSTVDDAALYFGVSSFSSDWVSKNKSILSGTDKAAIKYYNQVQAAEDTTAKAENEWAKLQDEIGYWLARTDRNYSDEEILAKINLDNYPTLKKLDAGREAGEPVALTRAVSYSGNDLAAYVDIMRNGTNAQTPYVQNDMISKKLDPASDEYSPYSVGSTIDDAALYFGTSGFDAQWLVDNKSILSSGDKTAIDYYRDVYDAEQFTQQAESELAELNAEISDWLKYTSDPDAILKEVQDGYPTLQKLDKSMKIGEMYPTTRAIDYRWQDIEQYVQQRCAEINTEPTDVLGVPQSDPVSKLKNETINAAGLVIKQIGTPGEKKTFDLAYSSNFGYYVQQIKAKMDSGAVSDTAIAGDALASEKEDTANRYGITPAMQSELEQQMLADLQNRNNSQLVAADAAATDPLKQDSRNVLEKTRDTVYGAASAVYDAAGNALNFVVESAKEMGESTFDLTIGQLMGTTFNQLTEESKGKSGVGVWKTVSAGVLSAGGNFNNAVLGVFANASDLAQYATELVGMKKGRNLARELQAANMNELQKAIAPVLENGTWLENIAMNTISTSINSAAMMAMGVPISNKVTAAFGGGLGTVNTAMAEGRIASAAQAAQVSPFVITQMSDTYEQVKEETGNTLQAIASGIFAGLMSLATNNTAYDEYTKRLGLGAESSAAMWARVSGSHMAANWGESALMWTKNALTIMGPAEGLQEVSESLAVKLSRDMWSGGTFDLNEWSQWTEQAKQEFMYGYLSGSLFYVTALPAFAPSRVMLNGMVGGDVATTTETLGEFIAQVAEDVKSEQYKPSVEAAIADVNKAEVIAKKVTSGESLEAARIEATQEIAKMRRDAEYAQRVRNADAAYAEIIEAKEASAPFKAIQNTIAAETEKAQTVDSTQEDQGALEALSKDDRIWNVIPHEGTKAEGFSVNWRIEKRSYGYGDTVEGAEPGYQSAIPTAYQYFVKTDRMQEIKAYSPEDAIRRLEIADKMARANAARTKQLATPATVGSISAIDAALSTNDLSAHTATIAAALTETDADIDAAVAAGKELADTYGSKEALRVVRDVKQAGVEGAELSMVAAALSKDENATIALDALFTDGSTPENIQKIVTAAHGISDPSGMQAAITDSMVADRVKELIGDGQLQGTQSYESALSQARQNLQTAQDNLEQAQRDYEVSGENAQIENARFIENPTAPETRNGIAQAINELRGKAIVTQQMESSVEKNKTQYVEAKKMLDSARNSAMKVIREQARLDVAQMQAERDAAVKGAIMQSVIAPSETGTPESSEANTPTGQNPTAPIVPTDNTGKRQFATETAQQPEVMPDWLQEELRTNPAESDYDRQTNKQQMQDGWNRIQQNGYDQTVQELLAKDRFDSIDTATANVILAKAFHDGDTEVALAMASKYNREGTKAGQELQSRKIFSNMSPTGVRVFVAGQIENQTQDYLDTHQAQRDRLNASAQAIIDDIASGSTQETTTYDDRFGMDLTALQRSLIDEYGLNKIARPGLHYNRATTKQRMLEAILAATNTTAENGLTLAKTLEYLNSNVPVVTEADLNYIGARIAEHTDANQTDERIANVAIARAYEAYANIVPETLRNKLRTYRYVSMLLSVPTVLRNIIGNTTQGVSNIAAHRVAVAIDAAIGAITGKRTVTNLNFKERADGWRGFVEETKNTYKDFVTDKVNTRNTDAAKFNVSARGRVYQGQFLETARHIEGFLLSVGDRNFWKKAYINSMTEQQKLVDRGKMIATIEEMQDRAEAEANYAIFAEDNAVRDALSKLKEIPGLGELLDFTIPFVGVPTNIIKRMWQFSPLGLTSTVIKHGINAIQGKNFDQNKFVMGMARGLTGTGLFAVGMILKSIGMIRLGTGDEEDQKVVGVRQAKGDQYTPYIQNPFTGEYVSLSVLAPFVSPITMGAAAQELFDGDEDAGNALLSAAFSGMDQIIDTSYLSTVQDLLYNPGDDSDAAHVGKVLLGSAVSQNVPNIISQIAASLDPYVRDTNDKNWIINTLNRGLISKIPGWRETLPEKVDITGKAVPNTKQGVRALLDPFTSTVAKDDPALNELLRLADATGKTDYFPADALRGKTDTLNGVARPLTPDEKEAYKKRYGTLVFDGGSTIDASGNAVTLQGIRSLMESAAYQNMTDAEKANAISGQVKAAKDGAVSEVVKQVGAEITESPSTEYEKKAPGAMPEYFASLDNAYMTQLNDLYEKTGDGAFIPTAISGTFSRKNKYSGKTEQFTLDSQQMESLWNMYGEELLKLMVKVDWSLPDEELAKALTSAYSTAQGMAKDRWAKQE